MDNRYDKGCLLGVGVYIEIECTAFACFELSLYAYKKYVSNTTIKSKYLAKNNIKSVWRLRDTELYRIICVHQTKLFCSLSHHTIMDMSLSHESIVPSLFPRDVLCVDNTRWCDFCLVFYVFYDNYRKLFVLMEKACVSEAWWCSTFCRYHLELI